MNSKLRAYHSCRTWLISSRGLARKVRNATCSPAYQIKDCGANRECPNCHFCIDNSDVRWKTFLWLPYDNIAIILYTKYAQEIALIWSCKNTHIDSEVSTVLLIISSLLAPITICIAWVYFFSSSSQKEVFTIFMQRIWRSTFAILFGMDLLD